MSRANVRVQLPPPSLMTLSADTHGDTELNQLTGIAAILTFPLDIEVVEEEEKVAREEAEEAASVASTAAISASAHS